MKAKSILKSAALSMPICMFILFSTCSQGQVYEPGQLYVCVYDTSGIPTFDGDIVIMTNDSLRLIFQKYGVYSFDRAFPVVDTTLKKETYLLDRVYMLKCNGDADSLMYEMGMFSDWIYYYTERIPIYRLIGGENLPYYDNTNGLYSPVIPNDPKFGQDWALGKINASQAWEHSTGNNVLIGIPDGGFNITHEDLKSQINSTLSNPNVNRFHGTAVAGCAAAATNNGLGKSSIGYNSKMILGSAPYNSNWNDIKTMSDNGARVINASFIACAGCTTVLNLIHLMADQGTLMVGGAGNGTETGSCPPNGNGYAYPASYDPVISVTSTGQTDNHIYIYNGTNHWHTHNDKVDVCAPGYGVLSTCYYENPPGELHNDCYSPENWGTSFAAPIVSGLAALIFSARACLEPEEVKYIIETTADDIYSVPGNGNFMGLLGHGRINAGEAVKKAKNIPAAKDERITGQVTWTMEHYIKDYILVDPGSTLTIKADVLFNTGAKVVVKPGGTVIIDGATLRNNFCHGMWTGIRVQGLRDESQLTPGKHGTVILSNGATIKNALTGIDLINTLEDTVGGGGQPGAGGIIQAENAFFINNKVAIQFTPYENFQPGNISNILDNISYFKNIVFKTDDQLIDPNENPDAFVRLEGVRGIMFKGCTFTNTIPLESNQDYFTYKRGTGIHSFNSSFTVDKFSPSGTDSSEFISLYRGIEAYGLDPDKTMVVNETSFKSLCKAIYLSGIDNARITLNNIRLYDSHVFLPDIAYGVYLDHCTAYKVEENILKKDMATHESSVPDHYGIVINNSGDDNNFIYNNTLKKMRTGILAQGDNRGTGNTGLQIKCNDFQDCGFDIIVAPDLVSAPGTCGIASSQGSAAGQSAPAGNLFDKDVPPWDSSDYYNKRACGAIFYYHNNKLNSIPESWPSDYSTSTITLKPTTYQYNKATSCPSQIGLDIQQLNLILNDEMDSMEDMANTGILKEEQDYQFQLISSAINDLTKVIMQRPDDEFFKRNTDRMSLYSKVTEEIKGLRSISWKYRIVFCYLAEKDTVNALKTLKTIKAQYRPKNEKLKEYRDYVQYVKLMTELARPGKSVPGITEAQKKILSVLSQNRSSVVGAYARNILTSFDPKPDHEVVFRP